MRDWLSQGGPRWKDMEATSCRSSFALSSRVRDTARVTVSEGLSYREFARLVRKYPIEGLLRVTAELAAGESRARTNGQPIELPITSFALAGIARTALVEAAVSSGRQRRSRHTDRTVRRVQLQRLCHEYLNLFDPVFGEDGEVDVAGILTRAAFEQFREQYSPMESLSRAHSLFHDYAAAVPGMPTQEEWRIQVGTDLDSLMRTGFALYVAMLSNGGAISRDVMKAPHVRPIWEPLSPDQLFAIIDHTFARSIAAHRKLGRDDQLAGREKWSYNSLTGYPLVTIGDDLVCPAPHLLIEKITATGLWYTAHDIWGRRFTDALGPTFETYVGDQLRLLRHATIVEEISYTSVGSEANSCDWIVVTDAVVLLVEVKCARPTSDYRAGVPEGLPGVTAKLKKAVGQLENTAQLIKDRHPNFTGIPADRPLRGLIVTLEPYFLRQTMREDLLASESLQITTAWAHELETSMAELQDDPNAGERLLRVLTYDHGILPSITDVHEGRPRRNANPITEASWDTWARWPATDGGT